MVSLQNTASILSLATLALTSAIVPEASPLHFEHPSNATLSVSTKHFSESKSWEPRSWTLLSTASGSEVPKITSIETLKPATLSKPSFETPSVESHSSVKTADWSSKPAIEASSTEKPSLSDVTTSVVWASEKTETPTTSIIWASEKTETPTTSITWASEKTEAPTTSFIWATETEAPTTSKYKSHKSRKSRNHSKSKVNSKYETEAPHSIVVKTIDLTTEVTVERPLPTGLINSEVIASKPEISSVATSKLTSSDLLVTSSAL